MVNNIQLYINEINTNKNIETHITNINNYIEEYKKELIKQVEEERKKQEMMKKKLIEMYFKKRENNETTKEEVENNNKEEDEEENEKTKENNNEQQDEKDNKDKNEEELETINIDNKSYFINKHTNKVYKLCSNYTFKKIGVLKENKLILD